MTTRFNISSQTPLILGDATKVIATQWFKFFLSLMPGNKSIVVPITGFSIVTAQDTETLILDPAGTLASGSVTLPPTPSDGDTFLLTSSQTITALTVTGSSGQTVKNAPTALTISATVPMGYKWVFNASNSTWYRLQ